MIRFHVTDATKIDRIIGCEERDYIDIPQDFMAAYSRAREAQDEIKGNGHPMSIEVVIALFAGSKSLDKIRAEMNQSRQSRESKETLKATV